MQTDQQQGAAVNSRRQHKQHGFTLIEAIVALVLIGTTGMALFSWVNSNIITLNRVQEINAKNTATINALEYMRNINPMLSPEGNIDLGSYRLSWQAQATADIRSGAGYPYGTGLYQLALYQTKVTLKQPGDRYWFDFTLHQVGYKKVREVLPPL